MKILAPFLFNGDKDPQLQNVNTDDAKTTVFKIVVKLHEEQRQCGLIFK